MRKHFRLLIRRGATMKKPWLLIFVLCCSTRLFAGIDSAPDLEYCSEPALKVGGGKDHPAAVTDTITVDREMEIGELQIQVEVFALYANELTVKLTGPDGTSIMLHELTGEYFYGIDLIWSDYGLV